MSPEDRHRRIESAIADFARAYQRLEDLQGKEAERESHDQLLPKKGDQKTGLIGEYWAIRYARLFFPGRAIKFGGHSEKGWDLKVSCDDEKDHFIQVKTLSDFGKGSISRICPPKRKPASKEGKELPDYWNELWLLWLEKSLQPRLLWKLKPDDVVFPAGADPCLENKTARKERESRGGSGCFKWDQAAAVDIRAELNLPPLRS